MKGIVYKEELMNLQAKPEYIGLTALQMQKDFSAFSLELFESESCPQAWQDLFDCVKPLIADLVKNDRHKLVQLFYRVDLSESMLAQSLSRQPLVQAVDEITVMLIYREWKKVKFKIEYSMKNNDRLENEASDE